MIRAFCDGTTLSLQGHAGAAPYGQDLVCAAVSALVYALAQRLTELEKQGLLETPPRIRLASGDAEITAVAKAPYEQKVAEDFHLIESGLRLLQNHYPDQLKLTV